MLQKLCEGHCTAVLALSSYFGSAFFFFFFFCLLTGTSGLGNSFSVLSVCHTQELSLCLPKAVLARSDCRLLCQAKAGAAVLTSNQLIAGLCCPRLNHRRLLWERTWTPKEMLLIMCLQLDFEVSGCSSACLPTSASVALVTVL